MKQGGACESSDGNSKEISEESCAEAYTSEDENEIVAVSRSNSKNVLKSEASSSSAKRRRITASKVEDEPTLLNGKLLLKFFNLKLILKLNKLYIIVNFRY